MIMKTVGVVLATYNGGRYLSQQIESILNQTHKPDKIYIVDDASSDGTKDIILKYARQSPDQLTFIENHHNLGAKKTFETGISACNTDYIALSDQDDIWRPDKISKLYDKLEQNSQAGLCFHDLSLIDERGSPIGKNYWEVTPEEQSLPVNGAQARERIVHLANPVPGCSMFFTCQLKKYILPIPPSKWVGHDWWISAVSFFFADPVFINEPLSHYRLHANQTAGIGIVLEKDAFSKNKIGIYAKLKRELKRLLHFRQLRYLKQFERKQRAADMYLELFNIIDKCRKDHAIHYPDDELSLLENRIKVALSRNQ